MEKRNQTGICVIRNIDPIIIEYLCQAMLFTTDETEFSIIEIQPLRHILTPNEIINDSVYEITSPLHNYILRDSLAIDGGDMVEVYTINPKGISDLNKYEQKIIFKNIIESIA